MSTFDLSAFAPARPAASDHLAERLRKEWADLMDQLLVQGKTIPTLDDKELMDEEKRHEITRWESLTTRVVTTKDLGRSHPLDIKFTFPEDVHAVVAQVQKKLDRWKLELATVPRVKSGRKSMAKAQDDPPIPTPEPSSSSSTRPNARPVVEIQVRNTRNLGRISYDTQQNDPPCERCEGKDKCIGKKGGGACNPCSAAKTKCSLSSGNRGLAAKTPGPSTPFSAATKEVVVVEATPNTIRKAKRERSEREGESKQDDEPVKRRIREIEAELLQLSSNAHDISNEAYQLAIKIREAGESLGLEDRK